MYFKLPYYPYSNFGTGNAGVQDGDWHAMCVYWDESGTVKLHKVGDNVYSGTHVIRGRRLPVGGTWVIGQDQDSIGRGFKTHQAQER